MSADQQEPLTSEEAAQMAARFDDPEFRRLFEAYARDLADPAARAETDAYLAQLEAEGRAEEVYGAGVRLVVPEPGFVVKTKQAAAAAVPAGSGGGDSGGKKEEGEEASGAAARQAPPPPPPTRVYINVCSSPHVAEMTREPAAAGGSDAPSGGGGGGGCRVNLPMLLSGGKPRAVVEGAVAAGGGRSEVWDLVINPGALAAAREDPLMMDLVATAAVERVEQASGAALLRGYKLPRLRYKGAGVAGDRPSVVALRTGVGGEVVDGRLRPSSSPSCAAPSAAGSGSSTGGGCRTTPSSSSGAAPARAPAQQTTRSRFSFGAPPAARQRQPENLPPPEAAADSNNDDNNADAADADAAADHTAPGFKHPCGAVTPAWRLVERARADLGDAWADAGRGLRARDAAPEALVLRVELPGVAAAADVALDVGPCAARLEVPGRYLLALRLPRRALDGEGGARFDRASGRLTLTLPVAPAAAPAAAAAAATSPAAAVDAAEEAEGQQDEAAPQAAAGPKGAAEKEDGAPTEAAQEEEVVATPTGCGGAAAPAAAPAAATAANELRWAELHARADSETRQHDQQQQQQQHQQQQQQRQEAKNSAAQAPAAVAAAPPVLLKPRLTGATLVTAADLE